MRTVRGETKVFVAGSRRLLRLNKDVKHRIDNIVDKGLTVFIGDANGADKAVQRHLDSRRYANVVVFCMEGDCRNNVGGWPTRVIAPACRSRRDFAYYSTKDRAMTKEADYGLMLWDGQSRGTLTSIIDLVSQGKPVVVFVAPEGSVRTLRKPEQLVDMLRRFRPLAAQRINHELQSIAKRTGSSRKGDTALLF